MFQAFRGWVARLLGRRPDADAVPPAGVRVPRHVSPRGRSGAVAVMEPSDPTSVSARSRESRYQRSRRNA